MKKTDLKWAINPNLSKDFTQVARDFSPEVAKETRGFHKQIPGYQMTPLVSLPNLAKMLGVGGIWVKDESKRLQLNAFKILGGSFAVYRYLKRLLKREGSELSYEELVSEETLKKTGKITFTSATDGNHGRGVAWAAEKLGHASVIYVHEDTSIARIRAIEGEGAKVVVVKGNYDDAVRQSAKDAEANGWAVISDTSWDDYTEIPLWITQGYSTMINEAQEQLAGQGVARPTHVFVQAGVGALAAAVVGYYHGILKEDAPTCVVVEPDLAACLYESMKANDGTPKIVTGKLDTIMAGLACGEPSPIAWEVLKDHATCVVACPDYVAAKGMRMYAAPLQGDQQVISGESGAVTLGALATIMREEGAKELREYLKLDSNSQVLFVSSEGNTDAEHHRRVVWEGVNPVPEHSWTGL